VVIWNEVQTCIWPSRCHCHSLHLAPVNPDWFLPSWFLPFWYLLTWMVPDKFQKSSKTIVCVTVTHTRNCFMALWILSRITWVSRYQKGKTNLDFTEARDSEWQWHQLGHTQICISPQTDNHTSTHHCFLQDGCPDCHPTNSIKALKARTIAVKLQIFNANRQDTLAIMEVPLCIIPILYTVTVNV